MSRHIRRQEAKNREKARGEQKQSDLKVLQEHREAAQELR